MKTIQIIHFVYVILIIILFLYAKWLGDKTLESVLSLIILVSFFVEFIIMNRPSKKNFRKIKEKVNSGKRYN